jgi:hypothetical protein
MEFINIFHLIHKLSNITRYLFSYTINIINYFKELSVVNEFKKS